MARERVTAKVEAVTVERERRRERGCSMWKSYISVLTVFVNCLPRLPRTSIHPCTQTHKLKDKSS